MSSILLSSLAKRQSIEFTSFTVVVVIINNRVKRKFGFYHTFLVFNFCFFFLRFILNGFCIIVWVLVLLRVCVCKCVMWLVVTASKATYCHGNMQHDYDQRHLISSRIATTTTLKWITTMIIMASVYFSIKGMTCRKRNKEKIV